MIKNLFTERKIIMNNIQIFNSPEFGEVHTIEINGEAWFIGREIAELLGYSNTRDALARHVDAEDKNTVVIPDGNKGNPNQTIINESGLYSLILSSKLPTAKQFKHWITSEVIPAIRRHGIYATPETIEKIINDPNFLITVLTELQKEQTKNKMTAAAKGFLCRCGFL